MLEAHRLLQLCCSACWSSRSTQCVCKSGCCTVACCLTQLHEQLKAILTRAPVSSATLSPKSSETAAAVSESGSGSAAGQHLQSSVTTIGSSTSRLGDGVETATVSLQVTNITCTDCSRSAEQVLLAIPGVIAVRVSAMTGHADVTYDSRSLFTPEATIKELKALGFPATVLDPTSAHCVEFQLVTLTGDSDGNGDDDDVRTGMSEFVLDKLFARSILLLRCELGVVESSILQRMDPKTGTRTIRLEYDPAITGPRRLVSTLASDDPSYHFQLVTFKNAGTGPDPMTVLKHQWSRRWWFAVAFCVPVAIIAFIPPAVGGDPQAAMDHELTEGLSVGTLILFVLATPIQLIVGWPLYVSAYRAARYGRTANADTLVTLSTTVAYVYSIVTVIAAMAGAQFTDEHFFETSAVLLTLIVLGRYLEVLAKGKTSDVLDKLQAMTVTRATLLIDYDDSTHEARREDELDMALIERGDMIKILPGARIATDGVIAWGTTTVDESMVTGESVAVMKQTGDRVLGSTVNENGAIHVRVTRTASENTLAAITQLVSEAQNAQPPVQRIADQVAAYFVPFILVLTVAVFVVWVSVAATGVVSSEGVGAVTFALRFAIATLIISCPCAIGLAVPTAIMAGTGVAAQHGVVFKSGETIERCAKVTAMVLDKTGTLTQGKPSVSSWMTLPRSEIESQSKLASTTAWTCSLSSVDLWRYIGAAESGSEHPVAQALLAFAKEQVGDDRFPTPESFESVPGRGIQCQVLGHRVCIGTPAWMEILENHITVTDYQRTTLDSLRANAETPVLVAVDGQLQAVARLRDELKPQARDLIAYLHHLKIDAWMCSGDAHATAQIVGQRAGLSSDHILGSQLPSDKATLIRRLQAEGHVVAMVGDGINDSPALAQADVGLAVAQGTDIAGEAAHVLLLKEDLLDIVVALQVARRTFATIKFNFFWAFLYNLIAIPLAIGVFYPIGNIVAIPPPLAGLSELLSSVPVVVFSLMLRFYRPPSLMPAQAMEHPLESVRVESVGAVQRVETMALA